MLENKLYTATIITSKDHFPGYLKYFTYQLGKKYRWFKVFFYSLMGVGMSFICLGFILTPESENCQYENNLSYFIFKNFLLSHCFYYLLIKFKLEIISLCHSILLFSSLHIIHISSPFVALFHFFRSVFQNRESRSVNFLVSCV